MGTAPAICAVTGAMGFDKVRSCDANTTDSLYFAAFEFIADADVKLRLCVRLSKLMGLLASDAPVGPDTLADLFGSLFAGARSMKLAELSIRAAVEAERCRNDTALVGASGGEERVRSRA